MEAPSPSSFVSRARTALHSAAAKADRVFTDIKSDLKPDRGQWSSHFSPPSNGGRKSPASSVKQSEDDSPRESKSSHESKQFRWRPPPISLGTKQDWQDRLRNIRIGRKAVDEAEKDEEQKMTFLIYDENLYVMNEKNDAESKASDPMSALEGLLAGNFEKIPPSSIIKQLAVAIQKGTKQNSMKDFLLSSRDSSPIKERAGLSLSAVRSLVLREKEDKDKSDFGDDEEVLSLIKALFDAEGGFLRRKRGYEWDVTSALNLARDIRAAPPGSFVVKVAEVIGSFKTMKKMALFWCRVVEHLRRLWLEKQHIAGIPLDQIPDLKSCLLYQQLQVINCCISRKRRHSIAKESLDTAIRESSPDRDAEVAAKDMGSASSSLYVRISSGELVLRLGADHPSDNLYMLKTGEPVYSPVTQECPLFTEDLIKETEEFVLRTGSVGAGCSQLFSDMQAFKAANPGCILEDFVRWHSPPDWTEAEECETVSFDSLSTKGQLSRRMQKEGNLWRELWEAAKPVPAVKQSPLFDEDLAVEGILNFLEDIPPLELFEQLFVSLLGEGLGIAEFSLSADSGLSMLFYECKEYVLVASQGSISEKVDDLCQVYETVEMMLLKPEDVLKMMKQAEDTVTTPASGEPKSQFKRLIPNFGSKNRGSKELELKNQRKSSGDNMTRQSFANFFDSKSSLFSKKPPKPLGVSPVEKSSTPDDNEWTLE
ncbi:uncharacterized protein LOC116214742 isoform X1 [Punica granatum]|uniref:Uncharacterized protein LOC116214742 isoform X1 n=1 Tax=Punica granatum TaxID=22663 RepID=A0A6P8EK14_PUNGR|nr:uncharacterized protein LOC116214742 isoform X1 [Punica granatum]